MLLHAWIDMFAPACRPRPARARPRASGVLPALLAGAILWSAPPAHAAQEQSSAQQQPVPSPASEPTAKQPLPAPAPNPRVARYLQSRPFAAKSTPAPPAPKPAAASPTRLWGRVIIYLACLAAVMIGGLYACKRLLPGSRKLFTCPGIDIMGRTHLDPRRYLTLLRVGRRVILLGVSPEGMHPITEIQDSEEVADLLAAVKPKSEAGRSLFRQLFHKHLDQTEAATARTEGTRIASDLQQSMGSLRDQVKMLRKME